MNVDLHKILFKNYITFDRLYAINLKTFHGIKEYDTDTVNLFIDVRSFTNIIFANNIEFSYIDNQTPIASSIINYAIYLRRFYLKYFSVYSHIYIIWASNELPCMNSKYTSYNAHNNMSFQSSIMKKILNMNLIHINNICPYLDGIYFINGGKNETGCIIQYILKSKEKNNTFNLFDSPNIIFTKDNLLYQLVANNKRTFIFYPSKKCGEDISGSVMKKNIYKEYRMSCYYKYNFEDEDNPPFELFPICMRISNFKNRNINGLYPFNKVCKVIKTLYDNKYISKNITEQNLNDIILSTTKNMNNLNLYNFENSNALNIIDGINFIDPSITSELNKGILDLNSPEDLKAVNTRYFMNYPLQILDL